MYLSIFPFVKLIAYSPSCGSSLQAQHMVLALKSSSSPGPQLPSVTPQYHSQVFPYLLVAPLSVSRHMPLKYFRKHISFIAIFGQ